MDEASRVFVEAMVGRLIYDIKELDDWQACLMLYGDGGTGKGTLVRLIAAMFPDLDVGAIASNFEQKFGLEPLYTKRLVVVPDMPRHFSRVLDQQLFQSMVSGDDVPVARKGVVGLAKVRWLAHLLIASNYPLDYNDLGGAISRRVVTIPFVKKVVARNDKLEPRIKKDELVTVLVRCLTRYHELVKQVAGRDFWEHGVPAQVRDAKAELARDTNPLADFLANGDDHYQIIEVTGAFTSREELSNAFSNHMQYVHKKYGRTLGTDLHPIKQAGYQKINKKKCKICNAIPASTATCGDHYNKKNRRNVVGFENMQITRPTQQRNLGFGSLATGSSDVDIVNLDL
jgi:phage/plasmid-associated DNA primase